MSERWVTKKNGEASHSSQLIAYNDLTFLTLTRVLRHRYKFNVLMRVNVYTVSQKTIPDIFSCNSSQHYATFIIFGKNITENLGDKNLAYFPTSPK